VSQRGCSIGQGVVKVKVVDPNGRFLTQGTAFVRLLAQAGMGLVPFSRSWTCSGPCGTSAGRRSTDKAVNCYVINDPRA